MKEFVDLLNEASMLASIPRSGFAFLGTGHQSVAEHTYGVMFAAYILSRLAQKAGHQVNLDRLLLLCLFHDLPEARMGDLNAVQKHYVTPNYEKILEDLSNQYSLGMEISTYIQSFEDEETFEVQLAKDADQIDLLLTLKKEHELGNPQTIEWMDRVLKKIKTKAGIDLAQTIMEVTSSDWWRQFTH